MVATMLSARGVPVRSARLPYSIHQKRASPARFRQPFLLKAISVPNQGAAENREALQDASDDEDLDGTYCPIFVDRDDNFIEVMCCDYGFRTGAGRMYSESDGRIPLSFWQLGVDNFNKELKALRRSVRYNEYSAIGQANPAQSIPGKVFFWAGQQLVGGLAALDRSLENAKFLPTLKPKSLPKQYLDEITGELTNDCAEILDKLRKLKLSNDAVWQREWKREAEGGKVETPWYVKGVYLSLCLLLDVMYGNRPIQRFWFLETVARMPYFSYITMLHLYESFGWWRAGAELRKIHFAEEWNELHHLQIMESLGGDQYWVDRFLGLHSAIMYYWILCLLFVFNPRLAYNFSELIEAHAVDTYGEFVDANEELLKSLPPPLVALKYYRGDDLYMFDDFQTSKRQERRRPSCSNLYDVFSNIRDDEGEHVKTMKACQDLSIVDELEARKSM